ncbi:hypothetical protein, partial [Burkholderia multivorans]|uniref:hypothetical protein n=1 Tax=Burkholderia multivorans TaxID=87883 RepID=UPI001E5666E7
VPQRRADAKLFYYHCDQIGTPQLLTALVQGVPCVVCGTVAPTMIADHKDALLGEYYRSGANNVAAQSAVTAVQSHCPVCSRRQGGMASAFSKCTKDKLGL